MKRRILAVLFIAVLCRAPGAFASDGKADKDWSFNLAPFYLWAFSIDGDQQIGPISQSVEVDFGDITDNLEMAFTAHFEALHKSNWGFLIDFNYLDLENNETIPNGSTRKVDLDIPMVEISGLRRWHQGEHAFDLIAGLRYVEISNEISILGGGTLADASQDWLDPLIGGRWLWHMADNWTLVLRGDVGGLQVGSDFTWHTLGALEWKPFDLVSFIAGYRALGIDYEDGNKQSKDYFHFDSTIHGPMFGVNFSW